MPGDQRITELMDHVEAMLSLVDDLDEQAAGRLERLAAQPAPDPHTLAFLNDLRKRLAGLNDLLEEDLIAALIGLNNLLGPVEHLLKEQDEDQGA
jgi:hypothetical protein